ncbi:hypothetical protein SDJN03_18505, partial [Cucurbita argyrosperma subsp. sororia]
MSHLNCKRKQERVSRCEPTNRGHVVDAGSSSSFSCIQFLLPSHFSAGFHSPTLSVLSGPHHGYRTNIFSHDTSIIL